MFTTVSGFSQNRRNNKKKVVKVEYTRNNVVIVKPKVTKTITVLPAKHTTYIHGKTKYYVSDGRYYRPANNGYILVTLPGGIRVNVLSYRHVKATLGKTIYYYSGGTYNKPKSGNNEYEVVVPKIGMIVPNLPDMNVEEVTINETKHLEFEGYFISLYCC